MSANTTYPNRRWLALILFVLPILASADQLTDLLTGKSDEPVAPDKVISTDASVQDDRKIKRRLQDIFSQLETLKTVEISVNKGVVTLRGEVNSRSTEDKALQFARQVEGVVEVENNLLINRNLQQRLGDTWNKLTALTESAIANLPLVLIAGAIVTLFWTLGRFARRRRIYRRISPNNFIANLIGQIIQLLLLGLGLVLALVLLDATALIGTLLGAVGIVGLAVGFAVRDTVENYIASILLSLRNPFEVNDFVNIDGQEGNVLWLTSRATVLISPDGNHIRIPNAMVFKAVITNFTRHPERRFQFDVGVDTELDLLTAQALALETLKNTEGVLGEPKPLVVIDQLGDSNVLLRAYGWVDQTQSSFLKVRSEAIRAVKEAFDQAGIVMPEPIYKLRLMDADKVVASASARPPVQSPPAAASDSVESRDIQDVSPDRTVEKRVEAEQSQDDGENLLSDTAPKEL